MFTVKIVSKNGITLYSVQKVSYLVHSVVSMLEFQSTYGSFGPIRYIGIDDEPDPMSNYNFISMILSEDIKDGIYAIFGPAKVYIMNEIGKTIDQIALD